METGGWIVASPNEWKKQKTNPSQNGNQRQIGLIALHLDLAGLTTPSSTKILVCHVKPTQVLVLASEEAIIIPSESWMCRSGEKGNKSACKTKSETKPQALLCSCWHDLPTLVPQVARTAQYKLQSNKWAIAPRKNIWATWACWSLGYQSFSHVPIDLSGQQLPEARGLVPGLQGAQHTRPAACSREMATAGGWDGTEQTWRISPSLHHWDLMGPLRSQPWRYGERCLSWAEGLLPGTPTHPPSVTEASWMEQGRSRWGQRGGDFHGIQKNWKDKSPALNTLGHPSLTWPHRNTSCFLAWPQLGLTGQRGRKGTSARR